MSWIFTAKISNLSKLQWHMFSKKELESGKLPPTFLALKYRIHWSYYMTYIWKFAISINLSNLWQTNFLLLSRWSNLVCVHARKQTVILYVAICADVWIVQILNLINLNSNEKSQYKVDVFMLMNSQLLNTESNPVNWRGFFLSLLLLINLCV